MIRVLISPSSPLTLAGLRDLLSGQEDFLVLGGEPADHGMRQSSLRDEDADVLVAEIGPDEFDLPDRPRDWGEAGRAVVLIVDAPSPAWTARALAGGVSAILPRSVSAVEMAATVRAVAAGLVVLHPDAAGAVTKSVGASTDTNLDPLTPREQEVLGGMADGLSNKEIAARLNISDHTVKFHVAAIMSKLGATSRTEAVTNAIRSGFLMI